jgi:hypothetical protein
MKVLFYISPIMTARTPEQINSTLDRTEQILSNLTITLDTVVLALANIPQIEERNRRRHQQHDLESDDHDERIEAIERLILTNDERHQEHERKMVKLQETQDDIRTILQILTARTTGEGTP